MLYMTDFSTASEMLNLNNPTLSDRRERSVGSMKTLLSSVLKTRALKIEIVCNKVQRYLFESASLQDAIQC